MDKKQIIDKVLEEVINQLDNGIAVWKKPFTAGNLPKSFITGKPYRGINTLILSVNNFNSPYYLTFKQVQSLGGTVKKGSKGTQIVFWKLLNNLDDKEKFTPILNYYTVFNYDQTEGIDLPKKYLAAADKAPITIIEGVQSIINGYKDCPVINYHDYDRAFYSPSSDKITLPNLEQFETEYGFAETILHELTHSTGHKNRLNRFEGAEVPVRFGDANYAKEELVAEIGASLLASYAGLELDLKQTGAYIAGWSKAIKDNPNMLIEASQKAQKAVDYILGYLEKEEAHQQ